jgi:hypothetical protein
MMEMFVYAVDLSSRACLGARCEHGRSEEASSRKSGGGGFEVSDSLSRLLSISYAAGPREGRELLRSAVVVVRRQAVKSLSFVWGDENTKTRLEHEAGDAIPEIRRAKLIAVGSGSRDNSKRKGWLAGWLAGIDGVCESVCVCGLW